MWAKIRQIYCTGISIPVNVEPPTPSLSSSTPPEDRRPDGVVSGGRDRPTKPAGRRAAGQIHHFGPLDTPAGTHERPQGDRSPDLHQSRLLWARVLTIGTGKNFPGRLLKNPMSRCLLGRGLPSDYTRYADLPPKGIRDKSARLHGCVNRSNGPGPCCRATVQDSEGVPKGQGERRAPHALCFADHPVTNRDRFGEHEKGFQHPLARRVSGDTSDCQRSMPLRVSSRSGYQSGQLRSHFSDDSI